LALSQINQPVRLSYIAPEQIIHNVRRAAENGQTESTQQGSRREGKGRLYHARVGWYMESRKSQTLDTLPYREARDARSAKVPRSQGSYIFYAQSAVSISTSFTCQFKPLPGYKRNLLVSWYAPAICPQDVARWNGTSSSG